MVMSELPDKKEFNLEIYSGKIKGVPLKHVVDSMYCTDDIPYFDGSYKPSQYAEALERMSNYDLKYISTQSWPQVWYDWKTRQPL